jgi:hypothetical protein
MRDRDGRLLRIHAAVPGEKPAAKGNAFLEDYAYVIHGLLNLYDATGEKRWLDEARKLTDVLMKWYADPDRGGFYYTAHDHEKLFARAKDSYDGAQPSGNGVQTRNLIRLTHGTGDPKYREFATKTIKLFAGVLKSNPSSVPGMAQALDEWLDTEGAKPEPKGGNNPLPPRKLRESADVVTAEYKLAEPAKDGSRVLAVTLRVTEPWHIYANPVANSDLKASQTTVELLLDGKPVNPTAIDYPKGKEVQGLGGAAYLVYEGTVTIKATLPAGQKNDPLPEARVKVIACKEGTCLLPSTLILAIK